MFLFFSFFLLYGTHPPSVICFLLKILHEEIFYFIQVYSIFCPLPVLFLLCRRQRRTASHFVQALEELKAHGRLSRPVLCSLHAGQELHLFCQACDLPICLECAATMHRDHRCCPAHSVIEHHGDRIRELVAVHLRPRLERLEVLLQKVIVFVSLD